MFAGEFEGDERKLLLLLTTNDLELPRGRDLLREPPCVLLERLHHVAVALVAEAYEVVVLGEHHRGTGGEVQREGRVALAEVVLIEDEILREVAPLAKHQPADARIDEAELVP